MFSKSDRPRTHHCATSLAYNGARPTFRPHESLKLTEEFEVDTNEITKCCPEGDLAGHLHC